jgi:hypothetical protein
MNPTVMILGPLDTSHKTLEVNQSHDPLFSQLYGTVVVGVS